MIPYGSLYPLQEQADAAAGNELDGVGTLVAADLALTGVNDLEAMQHL
jgi:hypothetical protein